MEETTIFLFDKFVKVEDEYNLFELEINQTKIWQYVRFSFCAKLLEELTGIRTTNRSERWIPPQVKKHQFGDWFRKHQFLLRRKDILVVNHPRRVKDGSVYKCYVTDAFLEKIKYSFYVFEDEYQGGHLKPVHTKGLKYRDVKALNSIITYDENEFKDEIRNAGKKVLNIYEREFGIKFSNQFKNSVFELLKCTCQDMIYGKWYAEKILKLVQPKAVIVTVYYQIYNQALIAVAKSKGIPTIELQHGRIGKSHAAYNFASKREMEVFPDYVFTYGQYEKEVPRFPIPKEKIYATGYPELEKKANVYKNNFKKKEGKVITFISSPVDGDVIAKYAIGFAVKMKGKDVRIVYKLHPSEYGNWKRYYPDLEAYGIQVIYSNQHDIYHYLGHSDYVVGISSTVLFEAMLFDVAILIIKEKDYLKCEAIFENNNAILISNIEELIEFVSKGMNINEKRDNNFYFENNSIIKMQSALDKCICDFLVDGDRKRVKKDMFERFKTFISLNMREKNRDSMIEKQIELSEKHLSLYLLMNQWVKIKQEGKSLEQYFLKHNYKNIAIYGMNYVGETLYRELKGTSIEVAYAIDKRAGTIFSDIEIVGVDGELRKVDAIVVTPIFYWTQIEADLKRKICYPIISIQSVLDEMENT